MKVNKIITNQVIFFDLYRFSPIINVFCKRVKMESSKRTRVVLLAREKRAIRNYYEEQTKK
jgi:hypothetical protein